MRRAALLVIASCAHPAPTPPPSNTAAALPADAAPTVKFCYSAGTPEGMAQTGDPSDFECFPSAQACTTARDTAFSQGMQIVDECEQKPAD